MKPRERLKKSILEKMPKKIDIKKVSEAPVRVSTGILTRKIFGSKIQNLKKRLFQTLPRDTIKCYPAIFEDNDGDGFTVTFPELPGCITEGDTEQYAYVHAIEALKLHLWGMERDHDEIPEPSSIRTVVTLPDQVVVLIRANMIGKHPKI